MTYVFISRYKLKLSHKLYSGIFHDVVSVPIFANTEWYIQKYTLLNMANNLASYSINIIYPMTTAEMLI